MSNQDLAIAEEVKAEEDVATTTEASSAEATDTATAESTDEPTEETAAEADEAPAAAVSEGNEETPKADSAADVESESEEEEDPESIYNLEVGQKLTGIVKNIVDFGAFVDVGIPQDGLVHISKLAKHKVEKVSDIVSQGQEIDVWVKKVDTKRGRLSLTMIKPVRYKLRDIEEGAEFEGTVTRLESYGAFVDIDSDRDGLVHISQITHEYIKHPEEALKVGDKVKVKVLSVNRKKRQIDLSIKALLPPPVKEGTEDVRPREEKPRRDNRSQSRHKRREPKVEQKVVEIPGSNDEPQLTAMAVAYAAAMQDDEQPEDSNSIDQQTDEPEDNDDIDEIVARTLASREK